MIRMILKFWGLLSVIIILALPVQAQFQPGDIVPVLGDELIDIFNGTTMDGIYKRPREQSGSNQFTETFHTNGSTTYHEGNIKDKGTWNIQENTICFRYEGPLSGGYSCFRVFKSGTCYYSFAPEAVIGNTPIDPNLWSVKTIIRGDVSSCDNLVS